METVYLIEERYEDGKEYRSMSWDMICHEEGFFETREAALKRCRELVEKRRSQWIRSMNYSKHPVFEELSDGFAIAAPCLEQPFNDRYTAVVVPVSKR